MLTKFLPVSRLSPAAPDAKLTPRRVAFFWADAYGGTRPLNPSNWATIQAQIPSKINISRSLFFFFKVHRQKPLIYLYQWQEKYSNAPPYVFKKYPNTTHTIARVKRHAFYASSSTASQAHIYVSEINLQLWIVHFIKIETKIKYCLCWLFNHSNDFPYKTTVRTRAYRASQL